MSRIENILVDSVSKGGQYDFSKKKTENSRKTFSINKLNDDSYSQEDIIGMTSVETGPMTSTLILARINREESTDLDPVVSVTIPNENGGYTDKNIHVYRVNPNAATDMEMFAYLSWNDHIGNKVPDSINSYQAYKLMKDESGEQSGNTLKEFTKLVHNAYGLTQQAVNMLSRINNIDARRQVLEGNALLDIIDRNRK